MATEIQTIKASQLVELTEVTDSNYVVVTDGATSKKIKATNLKGNSLTSTQQQQLSVAYTHSQSIHVQPSDIPTRTSQLTNNSGFATETFVTTKIAEASLNGGSVDLTLYQLKTDNTLNTTNKTVVDAINELLNKINTLQNKITALENQQSTTTRVTGVSLNNSTLTLNAGETNTLIATVLPTNATNKSVTWSTNNNAVASVNNGVVTAHAKGQATITVTTEDGNYSDTCIVTVDTSAVVAGSYVTDENGNRLMAEDGSYLITD